ncbi:c6 zinc finger domain containing protein [Grosmannia clavigera kw1407]|uniref:C6 zinc finger domain containing protein n=1 Tax=Grosmannia clavigera (strain kw1407 / UAMH 11150) TaxID=655863 RepID=F0XQP5_GROCL|nr:c6 zinc finger domain containing protein [Grosmannia clavigera kw1407]EFW99853.1 c6 zinc finger domain containing protein [Grosmannia clavigera kw1407]
MTKKRNRRGSSSTVGRQPQPPDSSLVQAPLPNSDEQLLLGEDLLNIPGLWPEDNLRSQASAAGMASTLPEEVSSRANFLEESFDQLDYGCLSALDIFSPSSYIQSYTSGTLPSGPPLENDPDSSPTKRSCRLSHLSNDDLDYLGKKGVFVLPPLPAQESLLKAYFLFIHPFLPVLAEDESWSEYEAEFVSPEVVLQLGYNTVAEAQESLFEKAKLLFDFETEDNELALVGSALLLSYRSPRADQKLVQKPLYWLAIAISLTKEISNNRGIQCPDSMGYKGLVKRLQWACAIRELVIALSSRNITEVEPCLPELPVLDVEDIEDSTIQSRVYDKEAKLLFMAMFLSLTELTRLVVKIRLQKSSTDFGSGVERTAKDQNVECLFSVEKASLELAAWRDKFARKFSLETTTSTLANLKMLVFHRNLALLLCESPIAINSGIVHTLQRPLYEFTQSSDKQEGVKLCINVLEEMQQRFPVVNDMIAMLYAAIQFAEREVATYSLNNTSSTEFGCGKDLLSGSDQEMIVREAFIISRTIHFLDGLFYKGYHNS